MKDQDIGIKIQAFVDGELTGDELAEIAALAARDPEVHSLVKELKQTRQALAGYEESVELPESREFYWSKIQRQIESLPVGIEEPQRSPWISLITRWLVPASCLAALVVAGVVFLEEHRAGDGSVNWQAAYDGVNAFTYHDYDEGMTVLWLSYAPDNTVANSEKAANRN
jgi:hypothetical protein